MPLPLSPSSRAALSPAHRFLALFVLILVLLILRRPDAVTNPQFWAEDGPVFLVSQLDQPGLKLLITPYAGYLLVVPRLVALVAVSFFRLSDAPLIFNLSALVLAALSCALFSLNRYRYLLQSDALRIGVCLVATAALQVDELVGNITCLHPYLLIAALLAILQPAEAYWSEHRWSAYVILGFGLLGGLSEPMVVLLLPMCVLVALKRRDIPLIGPAVIALSAGAQICALCFGGDSIRSEPILLLQTLAGSASAIVYRVVLTPMAGLPIAKSLSASSFVAVLVATAAALVVWLGFLWRQSNVQQRWAIAASVYITCVSVILAMGGRSLAASFFGPSGITQWRGERYFLVGGCLLAYLVALSLERWIRAPRAQVAALALVFASGTVSNFQAEPYTDYHWRNYEAKIEQWASDKRAGRTTEGLTIPINPPGWKLELPGSVSLTDGLLVRRAGESDEDRKVYLIEHGKRRWVLSGGWITAHGYKWPDDVRVIPAADLSAIPLGMPIEQ